MSASADLQKASLAWIEAAPPQLRHAIGLAASLDRKSESGFVAEAVVHYVTVRLEGMVAEQELDRIFTAADSLTETALDSPQLTRPD